MPVFIGGGTQIPSNKGIPIVSASSTDGVNYTATVDGVKELSNGLQIIIIPNIRSTSNQIMLNVNGLGATMLRQPLSWSTFVCTIPNTNTFLSENVPVRLMYHATYTGGAVWLMADKLRVSGNDLYGAVPIANGGTGADTADEARVNLGAAKVITKAITIPTTGWSIGATRYYRTALYDTNIKEADIVDINIDVDSYLTAEDCGLKGVTDSFNGGVFIHARAIPTAEMTGTMVITKGV